MGVKRATLMIAAGLVAGVGGCQRGKSPEAFFVDDEVTLVREALNVQAARGARADATLYAVHFDGGKLNSLGRQKLSLMIRDAEAGFPMTLYVDVSGDTGARGESIRAYLADTGLTDEQIAIKTGANPAALHRASTDLPQYKSMRDGKDEAGEAATVNVNAVPLGGLVPMK